MRRVAGCQVSEPRECAFLERLLVNVAVNDLGGKATFLKILGHGSREHHGAMLAAGTAESDGQITLALLNVVRNQVGQQAFHAAEKLAGLRERTDVAANLGVAAGEFA